MTVTILLRFLNPSERLNNMIFKLYTSYLCCLQNSVRQLNVQKRISIAFLKLQALGLCRTVQGSTVLLGIFNPTKWFLVTYFYVLLLLQHIENYFKISNITLKVLQQCELIQQWQCSSLINLHFK